MCMYSAFAEDGVPTPWHLVHYGSRAAGGAGLVMVEATAVEARGRISARDLGLWNDEQATAFEPIVRAMTENGATPAIQLAHAGRKAGVAGSIAPSALAFSDQYATPAAMGDEEMNAVIEGFRSAALRARQAGFQAAEIHMAHGYLLHEFLSPLSNRRDDEFGGPFENRIRFPLAVIDAVRRAWPDELPLFVRISATDWAEGGWDPDQSVEFARYMRTAGVDLVDVSSGGLTPAQQISVGPGYQVPFAAAVRLGAEIPTSAVGMITEAEQANAVIADGAADAVLIARKSLRDPYFPLRAARKLGVDAPIPPQYERGWQA